MGKKGPKTNSRDSLAYSVEYEDVPTTTQESKKREFCTEFYCEGKVYAGTIDADTFEEAQELCADNEKVVGELIKTLLVGMN